MIIHNYIVDGTIVDGNNSFTTLYIVVCTFLKNTTSITIHAVTENMSSRFSSKSEANASDLLENLEEICI